MSANVLNFDVEPSSNVQHVKVEAYTTTATATVSGDGTVTVPPPDISFKPPEITGGVNPPTTIPPIPGTTIPPTTVPPNPEPEPNPENLVADMEFEDSDPFKDFTSFETFGPAPTVVTDPLKPNNKVMKVLINDSSRDGDRLRNEATIWNLNDGMKVRATYGIKVFLHEGFKSDDNSNNFIQFHNAGIPGLIPNISFMLKNKTLDLNLAWQTDPNKTNWDDLHEYFNVSDWFGRWVEIGMDTNWFQDETGYFKLFLDGVKVYEYNGPMGYAGDTMGPYMKVGLHYPAGTLPAGSTQSSQYVLYDNVKVGNNDSTMSDVIDLQNVGNPPPLLFSRNSRRWFYLRRQN